MTPEEKIAFYHLQGRVMACERLSEALLLASAYQQAAWSSFHGRVGNPGQELDDIERAFMASLQHTTFHASKGSEELGVSPELDAVWEACGESVRLRFENVREKIAAAPE